MRQRKPYNCTMTMGTASGSRPLRLSKKRAWADKLHTEVLFADANELWIKTWEILTRHFASKMTARGHPRRVCGPAFFFLFAPEARKDWVPLSAESGQRLCLWNLPPFEKGGRKLFSFVQVFFQKRFFDTLRGWLPKGGIPPRRRSLSRRSGGSGKRVPPRRKKNIPKERKSLRDGAACRAVPAVPESVCRRVEKRTSPKGGILPRRRSLSRRSGGSGKRVRPRRL